MNRNRLLEKLEKYIPNSKEEIVVQREIINFVQNNKDCFERSLEIGHITASAWLLSRDGSKALLLYHAKLKRWMQLGGHCDGDSDVLAVAIKEAQEESGIGNIGAVSSSIFDLDVHVIPERNHEKAHYHYDIRFLLQVTSDEEVVQNHESTELRWVPKELSALPTDSESVVRMFKKWVQGSTL